MTYTGLASPSDEPELRQLLRENPIPGRISVSFEREPDYYLGAQVEGPFHQVIVARDPTNHKIFGMGTRSIRDLYLNGVAQPVGYLSQFRVDSRHRAMRKTFLQAFQTLYELHQDQRTPIYFTSIIADNLMAHRLFSKRWSGMPRFQPYARLHTLAIYTRKARRTLQTPPGLTLIRGDSGRTGDILDCLRRNNARCQLAPEWTAETLFNPIHTPNLQPEHFTLALEGEAVVGCLALWDQMHFKQTIVRGYSPGLDRWRKFINLITRLGNWPILPTPDTPFRFCFASHLAVDGDNPQVFACLLRSVYNQVASRGYDYFMLGMSEANPLLPLVLKKYRNITYTSQLYLVYWDEAVVASLNLDSRPAQPEIALL